MKPEHLSITFTRTEAEQLWHAASQVLGHEDAEQATFDNKRERNAAYRAANKLHRAMFKSHPASPSSSVPK